MRALLVLTFLLAIGGTAAAQEITPTKPTPVRDGFYIGFGFGTGQVSYHGDFSEVDAESALSGHLRLGGTLNQQWRIGGETNGWIKSDDGIDYQYSALVVAATFYPSPTGNFFLKGGVGLGAYTETDGVDEIETGGGVITLGLGYDFRFKGKFGISLVGNYVGASGWDDVEFSGIDTGLAANPSLVQLGVGVIWH